MKQILLGAPILFLLMCPGFAFAHHDGVSSAYRQGEFDGNTAHQNGDAVPVFSDCVGDGGNQATYGDSVHDYCNGFITGYFDGVIN